MIEWHTVNLGIKWSARIIIAAIVIAMLVVTGPGQ